MGSVNARSMQNGTVMKTNVTALKELSLLKAPILVSNHRM